MSIEALVLGKLHQRPEQRTSGNTGRPFVTAKVRAAAGDDAGVFINVVAFSDTAMLRRVRAQMQAQALAKKGGPA
jgi:hypothetical protein